MHVLRDMLELKSERKPIPVEEVEPASGGCWLRWVLLGAAGCWAHLVKGWSTVVAGRCCLEVLLCSSCCSWAAVAGGQPAATPRLLAPDPACCSIPPFILAPPRPPSLPPPRLCLQPSWLASAPAACPWGPSPGRHTRQLPSRSTASAESQTRARAGRTRCAGSAWPTWVRTARAPPCPTCAACATATSRPPASSRSPRGASASPPSSWSTRSSWRSRSRRAPSQVGAARWVLGAGWVLLRQWVLGAGWAVLWVPVLLTAAARLAGSNAAPIPIPLPHLTPLLPPLPLLLPPLPLPPPCRRGRPAAGQEGVPLHCGHAALQARRAPHLPPSPPRHLLHRGPGPAHLRPAPGQREGKGVGQAGGTGGHRHSRLGWVLLLLGAALPQLLPLAGC